jgi:hypothetical protein
MTKSKSKLMYAGWEQGKVLSQDGHMGFGLDELDG